MTALAQIVLHRIWVRVLLNISVNLKLQYFSLSKKLQIKELNVIVGDDAVNRVEGDV